LYHPTAATTTKVASDRSIDSKEINQQQQQEIHRSIARERIDRSYHLLQQQEIDLQQQQDRIYGSSNSSSGKIHRIIYRNRSILLLLLD
jgi:uncharacterized membrane protein YqiK